MFISSVLVIMSIVIYGMLWCDVVISMCGV